MNMFKWMMREATVNKSNPKYIGFLLSLYSPPFLSLVATMGNSSIVDFPKLTILIIDSNSPIAKSKYAK